MRQFCHALVISCIALSIALSTLTVHATPVFINEFHYDNTGPDRNEAVEIAGTEGFDLTGWSLQFYNGADGEVYRTTALSGLIPSQSDGYGTLSFGLPSMQNGPDGLALFNATEELVQFLSYEGSFTATNGLASGATSLDIGLSETAATSADYSLQLVGQGRFYQDFSWLAAPSSFGSVNLGQGFAAETPVVTLTTPASNLLCLMGLGLLITQRRLFFNTT